MPEFNDEELEAMHGLILDKALYGDDEMVYGDGPEAIEIRALLTKVTKEAARRGLWWAR